MPAPIVRHISFAGLSFILWLASFVSLASPAASGQESVLVADFGISVYDMGLNNLEVSAPPVPGHYSVAVDPNNPRLVYSVGNGNYEGVFDLTLGREVNRIYGVCDNGYSAFTAGGKYLLVGDCSSPTLDIIDVAGQTLVRRVNLSRALGVGASTLGSIVVAGNKAYVACTYSCTGHNTVAVVDLKTFQVRSVAVPGPAQFYGSEAPNAALTPDQKYVIVAQDTYINSKYSPYLYFISTATDRVTLAVPQTMDPEGILVTPVNSTGSVYGYLLGLSNNTGNPAAIIIDLNPGSPTFGQQLPGTSEVDLQLPNYDTQCAAINSTGTRLVVGGFPFGNPGGNNLVMLDTALMISNPSSSVIAQTAVVGIGSSYPAAVSIANVVLTSPPSAPTVASVITGPINNASPNTITVTGSNFLPGARVRVGTMPPLAANVLSPSTLTATVPQNAPGKANLDVVVTNPGLNGPASQQHQSGVLPSSLTLNLNPAYQPQNRFAAFSFGGLLPSAYDPTVGSMFMSNTNSTIWASRGVTFNADGKTIYGLSPSSTNGNEVAVWDSSTLSVVGQIPLVVNLYSRAFGPSALAASVNPQTGSPLILTSVNISLFNPRRYDVALKVIDSNPANAGTYNTVVATIPTGQNFTLNTLPYACAVTPDGKYAYLSYRHTDPNTLAGIFAIAIFDMSAGTFSKSIDTTALGIAPTLTNQATMQVTPDGQSLIVEGASSNRYAGPIAVLDISNPTNPVLVTTITGTPPPQIGGAAAFNFSSYQVVGNRLFAFDRLTRTVVVFNFDRTTPDFSQLATYSLPRSTSGVYGFLDTGTLTVTPDGALVYVTNPNADSITVLDAVKLASGQDPFITNIGAYPGVYQVAVSPATLPNGPIKETAVAAPSGSQPQNGHNGRPLSGAAHSAARSQHSIR